MKQYIEREAALDRIRDYIEEYSDVDENGLHDLKWCAMKEAEMVLTDIPAADVREVVLCRDCIHLSREKANMSGFYRCDRYDAWQDENDRVHMPLDGFCSYGDRGAEMKGESNHV